MSSFHAKPLKVQAEQFAAEATFDLHHSDEREAARLRHVLEIADPQRIAAGSLLGWIEFFNPAPYEDGMLRPGMWLVRWPDGHLSAMRPHQFEMLFTPHEEG